MVGLIFNGFFASGAIIGLDGVNSGAVGGFLDGNYRLLGWQIAAIVAASSYSFIMSAIIAKLIDMTPGLHLRATEQAELLGMDDDQHGEFSYDYVEVRRDFLAWSPQRGQPAHEGEGVEPQHGIQAHADMACSPPTSSDGPVTAEKKDPEVDNKSDRGQSEKQD
jgi:Amt family ammonium transporter